jgi:2-C-methyl-D-erythritol 4-phosphate cytidylyltransferase
MRNIGVILAGGTGSRLGAGIPKQFLPLKGKEILLYSVETFLRHKGIDEVAIVTHKAYLEQVKKLVKELPRHVEILTGGQERYESSLNALKHYSKKGDNIILHDAARPLVSEAVLNGVLEALKDYEAVTVAVPTTDTILVVDELEAVEIPQRRRLYNCQTPQGFRLEVLEKAYELGLADAEFVATDDCGVVKKYLPHKAIRVVLGEPANMKLTYEKDMVILESYLG